VASAAGCGSSPPTAPVWAPPASGTAPTTSGAVASIAATLGAGVSFTVHVSFTGSAPVEGSFVDRYTGRSYASCAEYARAAYWLSPGAVTGTERLGGTALGFDFALPPGGYRGPGTYSPGVLGRVSVGDASFVGTDSTVTVAPDGSGHGAFRAFAAEGSTDTSRTESGTVTWTCSEQ
ncbi:MAG TPA: hypothetical protein VEY67_12145, partial [Candidatus Dormibacteraeota bacterium]|nr:hypothetical protein [Candidatus Dormibacteraeota bacterium]